MPSLPGSGQEFPLALRLKRGEPLAMAGAVQLESGSPEQRRHWDGAVLHPCGRSLSTGANPSEDFSLWVLSPGEGKPAQAFLCATQCLPKPLVTVALLLSP